MGTKIVWILNQCSCSSTVPGKSQGDTEAQTAHHHGSGVGLQAAVATALLIAGLSWEQRMEKGPVPQPCHPITITSW